MVAEVGKALGRPQHTLERSLAPCAEEGREIRLARLRVRGVVEAGAFAEPPIGVADGHQALPVTALEGGRVRLAPEHLGAGEVVSGQRVVDSPKPSLPRDLCFCPEGVVGEGVDDRDNEQHQAEHRGERHGQRAIPAAR